MWLEVMKAVDSDGRISRLNVYTCIKTELPFYKSVAEISDDVNDQYDRR